MFKPFESPHDGRPVPSLPEVAWAFTRVGLLSFGGGSASQLLMRRELVWKTGWITDAEYNRLWQLTKLTVGIQQIGQVILYSGRLAGRRGIAVGVAGFMVPSVVLTAVMSLVLGAVIGNRYVEDALKLVIPLTGGMTMAIALQMWSPQLPGGARQWFHLLGQGLLVLICSLLVGVVHMPVLLILIVALGLGALMP